MPRRSDRFSRILSEFLGYTKQSHVTAEIGRQFVQHVKTLDLPFDFGESDLDWDNPIIRQVFADSVGKIYPGKFDQPVALAFKKAGLDPKNLIHWRILLSFFCHAFFGSTRKRGAPRTWTAREYARLLQDADQVKVRHPDFSRENVYITISKQGKFKKKNGQPLAPGRIKTALREARNPDYNASLAAYLQDAVQKSRISYQQQGKFWSPKIEAELIKHEIEKYCETIASAWRRAEIRNNF